MLLAQPEISEQHTRKCEKLLKFQSEAETVAASMLGMLARGGAPPVFASSGIQWMTPAFWSVLACVAGAVIVPLQYFRRTSLRARTIALGVALARPC